MVAWQTADVLPLLLGVRFLLEICLLAAFATIGISAFDSTSLGVLSAVVLVGIVAGLWGWLLAPRRRLDLPLPARLLLELVLYAAAALGLATAGFPDLGLALVAGELVVLVALALVGYPPGGDLSPRHAGRS